MDTILVEVGKAAAQYGPGGVIGLVGIWFSIRFYGDMRKDQVKHAEDLEAKNLQLLEAGVRYAEERAGLVRKLERAARRAKPEEP